MSEVLTAPATIPATLPEAAPAPLQTIDRLSIEKLIYGGDGLGRLPSGEVYFVPGTVPGDIVAAQQLPGSKKAMRAQVTEMLSPSSERVTPQCSVFETCGGCQWQHVSMPAQQHWKAAIVEESLTRLGGLQDVAVQPILQPYTDGWRSRNRVQWHLDASNKQLGYREAQAHTIVGFDDCKVISDAMNRAYHYLQNLLTSHVALQNPGLVNAFRRIEIFENSRNETLISFYGDWHPALRKIAPMMMEELEGLAGVVHFRDGQQNMRPTVLRGEGFLLENLGAFRYRVSAGSFFQTNHKGAETMLDLMRQWISEPVGSLIDLYAGVGTFAIGLHDKATKVVAIESAESAIRDAEQNLRSNQVTNVNIRTGQVEKSLMRLDAHFDVAVIDPPRGGCLPEVLNWLNTHVDQQLIYVSCNPTTLARDLKKLMAAGWKVASINPIDLFPQTYHVETLVQLTRK